MRRLSTVCVVGLALLVATSPAAAATTEVGSQHTNVSELESGTLTNVTVEGSGQGADAVLDDRLVIDSFEGGDLSEYQGDTGSASIVQNHVTHGQDALRISNSGVTTETQINSTSGLPRYLGNGDAGYTDLYIGPNASSNDQVEIKFGVSQDGENWYSINLGVDDNAVRLYNRTSDGAVTLATASATLNHDQVYEIAINRSTGTSDGIEVEIRTGGSTIASLSASEVNTLDSADGIGYRVDSDNSNSFEAWIDYARLKDRPKTGTYSNTHSVDRSEAAKVNLTLQNAAATVTVKETGSGNTLKQTTFTTGGNKTLSWAQSDATDLTTKVKFDRKDGTTTAKLHDEAILFSNNAPSFDDSTAKPQDGANLSNRKTTYSINVSDPQFGTEQGESLTATLFIDGSSVGSKSVSSNGTVSITHTISEGGEHTYDWEATDSYGATGSSSNFAVNVPNTLYIYNESSPDKLVDNATVTVRLYPQSGNGTETITSSDGTVNMSGVPADTGLIVTAEADGYRSRRIYIPSLYETQNIYLLPNSTLHTDVIFRIEDYSGEYPQDVTVMEVQRSINGSWQTVMGDYFGATGQFPAQLAYNIRHRLVIRNTVTGQSRILGTYTPLTSSEEVVSVSPTGTVEPLRRAPELSIRPSTRRLVAEDGVPLTVSVRNRTEPLVSAEVAIYHLNGTNTTLFTDSTTSATGVTWDPALNLTGLNGSIKVVTSWETSEAIGDQSIVFMLVEPVGSDQSLLDGLGALVALAPAQNQGQVTTFFGMVVVIIGTAATASAFRLSTEVIGSVAVLLLAAMGVLGWLGYDLVAVSVVAWAALVYLRRRY